MTRISEAQTRNRFIDQRLKAAGYALRLDGQIVAVIEAKKLTLGPQNVLTQAQRDTQGLPQPAPFLYSTNGEVIWHHDIRHKLNRSRQIAQFHSPAGLREQPPPPQRPATAPSRQNLPVSHHQKVTVTLTNRFRRAFADSLRAYERVPRQRALATLPLSCQGDEA